jgi:hypothetical protein
MPATSATFATTPTISEHKPESDLSKNNSWLLIGRKVAKVATVAKLYVMPKIDNK